MRILVIDLAFIGDVILATPTFHALKTAYPGAHLTVLTVPLTAEIAALCPDVDEVAIYDKRGRDRGFFGMWRVAKCLRDARFDLAVCMNFALRGAFVAWLAGIPKRAGYDARHAGWFLTHTTSHVRDGLKHESRNHLEVLRALGISDADADSTLRLVPGEDAFTGLAEKRIARHIPEKAYLVLCPFGSYARKDLPLATIAHVLRYFSARRAIYLIGGTAERSRLLEAAKLAGLPEQNVLGGDLTLSELAAFLSRADTLITVDTGPLHIAQAVGCRTVAIFGPTDPAVWGPRGARDITLTKPYPCAPCWGRGACEHQAACVGGTTAREIIRAVRSDDKNACACADDAFDV